MKKTLTVNLGGTVYHIDEDAYRLLDNYLNNLRLHFRKQQGAEEIVNDMENRIAELFSEKVTLNKQVITIPDVEEVISRMGKPEDFGDNSAEDESHQNSQYAGSFGSSVSNSDVTPHRRLYRDPNEKMLGGVAAGLAAYLGWDITLVRILMVILVFIPYCTMIIFYLIAWIVIPEARTAAEKLSMRGQTVTVENIGKTVTDSFERVSNGVNDYVGSGKPRSFLQKTADLFVSVAAFLFKLLLIIIAIVLCPILFIAAVALIFSIIGITSVLIGAGEALFNWLPTLPSVFGVVTTWESPWMFAGCIVLILFVMIPIFALVYTILCSVFNCSPISKGLRTSMLVTWLITLPLMLLLLFAGLFFTQTDVKIETTRCIQNVVFEEPIHLTDTVHNKDTIRIDSQQH